ncbi:hypothetical protein EDD18DRAFT_1159036, partial [Armillaria luteobubalina]
MPEILRISVSSCPSSLGDDTAINYRRMVVCSCIVVFELASMPVLSYFKAWRSLVWREDFIAVRLLWCGRPVTLDNRSLPFLFLTATLHYAHSGSVLRYSLGSKYGHQDDEREARVKEYEARLGAAEERVKRERQGGKERVAELEASVRALQRQL